MGSQVRYNEATGALEQWSEVTKSWQVKQQHMKAAISGGKAATVRQSLVESYQALGLNEAEAKIAAGVDKAVKSGDVNKSFDSGVKLGLFEGAKRLGLSDAEALVFADPSKATVNSSPFLPAASHRVVDEATFSVTTYADDEAVARVMRSKTASGLTGE